MDLSKLPRSDAVAFRTLQGIFIGNLDQANSCVAAGHFSLASAHLDTASKQVEQLREILHSAHARLAAVKPAHQPQLIEA